MKRTSFIKLILVLLCWGLNQSLLHAENVVSTLSWDSPGHYYTSNDPSTDLTLEDTNYIQADQEVTILMDNPDLVSYTWSLQTPGNVKSISSNEARKSIFFTVGETTPNVVTFNFVLNYGNRTETFTCHFRVRSH